MPFDFAGGLHDRDIGLVRFGYRDYDPDTGRWTAKDPILFAGGDTDLYGYCVGDPINSTDLFGLAPYDIESQMYDAAGAMLNNYMDMLNANFKNQDKYFHCKANCEAAQKGPMGKMMSEIISELREQSDMLRKGDSDEQCDADREANKTGRDYGEKNPYGSCKEACKKYRPKGLPPQY